MILLMCASEKVIRGRPLYLHRHKTTKGVQIYLLGCIRRDSKYFPKSHTFVFKYPARLGIIHPS